MGVQGLTSLIETHPEILRDVKFRRNRLLIDGCNLLYLLYFNSGLDQNHGGEYAAFEALLERFFSALADCQVEPFVVLDGGSDYTDKKLETVTQRAEDRIRKAHKVAVGEGRGEQILPQLVKKVFKQTLVRLKVPVAQCYFEADQEIAALANEWCCPVLTNDSDFYVFPLPAGVLPISHFRWDAVERSGSRTYIPCKNYNTRSFCIVFDLPPPLLPAFAALAGNDYVKLQRMDSSISWAQFAPAGSERPSALGGLMHWLRHFHQPQEAFQAVPGLLGDLDEKRKAKILEGLYRGMEEYQIPPSSLSRFFIHGTAPPFPAVEQLAALVPDWTRLPLTQARLTADILDVLLLKRLGLSFPVDPEHLPSANLTSRPLRQLLYGLLLGSTGRPVQVEERDRDGLQLKVVPVQPAFRGAARQLALSSLHQAEVSQRLQVLLEALGVTEDSLRRVPPQLRLPVAVTCYWMQKAQPPPGEGLMRALLLGVSNGDALRRRGAVIEKQQRIDVRARHAFNQWQGCLRHSLHLNQLLGFPLPEPHVARLFEGTLVHQLNHLMRTKTLKPFLKHDRSSVKQYKTMLAVVHRVCNHKPSAPSDTSKAAAAPERRPLGDLTADFQRLFLQCDDDDEDAAAEVISIVRAQEDMRLDDLMSVRTRYRVKERNNRSNNPELARKEECRGRGVF